MAYVSNELNMQSYKQQLQYKTTVTAVENRSELENKSDDEISSDITDNTINAPFVFNNERDMSTIDKAKKVLMQSILGMFSKEGDISGLFPNDSMQMSTDKVIQENPYSQSTSQSPFGFLYESSSEYYEKTTIEFNAQATIKTPQGEYQIEINFSYTQEFYEKNETQIYYAQSNLEKPLEINLDEDDGSLKDIKRLDILFDMLREEDEKETSLIDEIKKILYQRQQLPLKSEDEDENKNEPIDKPLDDFRVFERHENSHMSLLAIQKDGVGVFLSSSHSSSSYLSASFSNNTASIQSGYSEQQSASMAVFTDLKA